MNKNFVIALLLMLNVALLTYGLNQRAEAKKARIEAQHQKEIARQHAALAEQLREVIELNREKP